MYTNIDALPLGKLLQPKQQKGVKQQVSPSMAGRLQRIRRKGPPERR